MSLTALAFLGAYGLALVSAFTVHPRWGLYTYLAVFYLHPPLRWWGVGLPTVRWSLVAAVVTVLALAQVKPPAFRAPWSSLPIAKIVIAYVAYMWVQLAWANPDHFEDLILMTKYALLFFIIYRLVVDEKGLIGFAVAHVLGCLYFGLLAFDADSVGRLEGIGGPGASDANTLGMHVVTGLFFAGSLILCLKGWKRWAVLMSVPFLANCVVQTESRGAFLGAICGAAAYYYFSQSRHRRMIIALGTISVFILLAHAPATYWERMGTIDNIQSEEEEVDYSAESRIHVAKSQIRIFLDHPFGFGARTTAYFGHQYLDEHWLGSKGPGADAPKSGRASHNTFLTILTDQGIPGVVLACMAFFVILGTMRKMKKHAHDPKDIVRTSIVAAVCASLVDIAVSGLFTNYLRAEVQIWCLALLMAAAQMTKPEAHQPAPSTAINERARPAQP
jgi:hypothetical protein